MSNKPGAGKLQIVSIGRDAHQLAAIDTIEYLLDTDRQELTINVNNVEVCVMQGKRAIATWKQMAE